ncbi:MAG TPA: class I SAM-dependent methyltransferase [Burkholderiaceae bacterium]|nr:class I SAM-dependent methyltransferase [Burkholderiaceae bacterium]
MAAYPDGDPTRRFGTRAAAYARARPSYPDAAVAELSHALKLAKGCLVVDLGCGTGLSSEVFLRAGFRVIGIEPSELMRLHAMGLADRYPGFTVLDGRAEATAVDAGCADLVIAAQAFHWFDVAAARREALRISRRPAQAALLWNDRRTDGSEFALGYEQLLRRFCTDYAELQQQHARPERVTAFFGNERWRTIQVAHSTPLDLQTLTDRLNSASYVPAATDPRHSVMMRSLRELFVATAREGVVQMEFATRVHFGQIDPVPLTPAAPPAGSASSS